MVKRFENRKLYQYVEKSKTIIEDKVVIKSLVGTWFRKSLIALFITTGKRTIEYLLSFGTIFVTTIFSFYFEIKVKAHFHHSVLARPRLRK